MPTEKNTQNNYLVDIHGIQAIKISQLRDINDNSDDNQTHIYSYQYMWDINNSYNYGKYGVYSDLNDYKEDVSYHQDYQSCYLLLAVGGNNYKLEYGAVKDDLGIPDINANIFNINNSIDCLTYDINQKVNFLNTYHNSFTVSVLSTGGGLNTDDYIKLSYTENSWSPRHDSSGYNHYVTPIQSYKYDLSLKFSYKTGNHIAYADLSNNMINNNITEGLIGHALLNDLIDDIKSSNSYFNNRLTWCRLDKK